ncbi:Aste57867_15821 [Aphanomyces stellatus]|uniref:Aste57867_15821 protein n=1 Tax=Aphanomyces stellatus TaxID=120398 RepID=A0A485L5W4_9STRA|nr:hypothetical protein As57867_015765 [Aphanomyces stellatus]VFT92609.1 Aste57867_15821 [Aphanomyces stellatus]
MERAKLSSTRAKTASSTTDISATKQSVRQRTAAPSAPPSWSSNPIVGSRQAAEARITKRKEELLAWRARKEKGNQIDTPLPPAAKPPPTENPTDKPTLDAYESENDSKHTRRLCHEIKPEEPAPKSPVRPVKPFHFGPLDEPKWAYLEPGEHAVAVEAPLTPPHRRKLAVKLDFSSPAMLDDKEVVAKQRDKPVRPSTKSKPTTSSSRQYGPVDHTEPPRRAHVPVWQAQTISSLNHQRAQVERAARREKTDPPRHARDRMTKPTMQTVYVRAKKKDGHGKSNKAVADDCRETSTSVATEAERGQNENGLEDGGNENGPEEVDETKMPVAARRLNFDTVDDEGGVQNENDLEDEGIENGSEEVEAIVPAAARRLDFDAMDDDSDDVEEENNQDGQAHTEDHVEDEGALDEYCPDALTESERRMEEQPEEEIYSDDSDDNGTSPPTVDLDECHESVMPGGPPLPSSPSSNRSSPGWSIPVLMPSRHDPPHRPLTPLNMDLIHPPGMYGPRPSMSIAPPGMQNQTEMTPPPLSTSPMHDDDDASANNRPEGEEAPGSETMLSPLGQQDQVALDLSEPSILASPTKEVASSQVPPSRKEQTMPPSKPVSPVKKVTFEAFPEDNQYLVDEMSPSTKEEVMHHDEHASPVKHDEFVLPPPLPVLMTHELSAKNSPRKHAMTTVVVSDEGNDFLRKSPVKHKAGTGSPHAKSPLHALPAHAPSVADELVGTTMPPMTTTAFLFTNVVVPPPADGDYERPVTKSFQFQGPLDLGGRAKALSPTWMAGTKPFVPPSFVLKDMTEASSMHPTKAPRVVAPSVKLAPQVEDASLVEEAPSTKEPWSVKTSSAMASKPLQDPVPLTPPPMHRPTLDMNLVQPRALPTMAVMGMTSGTPELRQRPMRHRGQTPPSRPFLGSQTFGPFVTTQDGGTDVPGQRPPPPQHAAARPPPSTKPSEVGDTPLIQPWTNVAPTVLAPRPASVSQPRSMATVDSRLLPQGLQPGIVQASLPQGNAPSGPVAPSPLGPAEKTELVNTQGHPSSLGQTQQPTSMRLPNQGPTMSTGLLSTMPPQGTLLASDGSVHSRPASLISQPHVSLHQVPQAAQPALPLGKSMEQPMARPAGVLPPGQQPASFLYPQHTVKPTPVLVHAPRLPAVITNQATAETTPLTAPTRPTALVSAAPPQGVTGIATTALPVVCHQEPMPSSAQVTAGVFTSPNKSAPAQVPPATPLRTQNSTVTTPFRNNPTTDATPPKPAMAFSPPATSHGSQSSPPTGFRTPAKTQRPLQPSRLFSEVVPPHASRIISPALASNAHPPLPQRLPVSLPHTTLEAETSRTHTAPLEPQPVVNDVAAPEASSTWLGRVARVVACVGCVGLALAAFELQARQDDLLQHNMQDLVADVDRLSTYAVEYDEKLSSWGSSLANELAANTARLHRESQDMHAHLDAIVAQTKARNARAMTDVQAALETALDEFHSATVASVQTALVRDGVWTEDTPRSLAAMQRRLEDHLDADKAALAAHVEAHVQAREDLSAADEAAVLAICGSDDLCVMGLADDDDDVVQVDERDNIRLLEEMDVTMEASSNADVMLQFVVVAEVLVILAVWWILSHGLLVIKADVETDDIVFIPHTGKTESMTDDGEDEELPVENGVDVTEDDDDVVLVAQTPEVTRHLKFHPTPQSVRRSPRLSLEVPQPLDMH